MLVYLDSNIVIYLIEQPADFGVRASARLEKLLESGDEIVMSDLTRLECRSNAMAAGDAATLAEYDAFFEAVAAHVIKLTTAICDRATVIRAQYRFKIPDAIHLAAAIEAGSGAFLTNDLRLSGFPALAVELLE
ncbi:MAG: type II toxin-antitoxin system VapC family toxin [Pirellulales bacterium]